MEGERKELKEEEEEEDVCEALRKRRIEVCKHTHTHTHLAGMGFQKFWPDRERIIEHPVYTINRRF